MMTNQEKAVRKLADLAEKKAHVDALNRLMVALRQELRAAGIKDVQGAVLTLNEAIRDQDAILSTDYDDVLFELTS